MSLETLVVGLDAATWSIIDPLRKCDKLPHLTAICESGVTGPIESTNPPMTPQAWTTAATGVNPGKHGIFDFLEQDPETYSISPVNYSKVNSPAIWDIFNFKNQKVGFVNYPLAYPPPSINGCFVSGIPHSITEEIAHPESLNRYLESIDYRVQPETDPKQNPAAYLKEIKELSEIRADLALHLLDEYEFALFGIVFMGIDWVQHYLWDTKIDRLDAVEDIYCHMDSLLGRILNAVDDSWNIVIVSDHGAREIHGEIHLNSLLEQWGYLQREDSLNTVRDRMKRRILKEFWKLGTRFPDRLKRFGKKYLSGLTDSMTAATGSRKFVNREIDWSQTKAFSFGAMGRVFIHDEERYRQGVLGASERDTVHNSLIERFESLQHPESAESIIQRARPAADVYEGPKMDAAPDIVLDPEKWRYMMYGDFAEEWIHDPKERLADHDPEGIVIMDGPAFDSGSLRADLADLTPTLLALHGLPIVDDMEGDVLWGAFSEDVADGMSVERIPEGQVARSDAEDDLTREEAVKGRLEDLGYL